MNDPKPWSALFLKRTAAELSLTMLATLTGYSVAHVGHVERGIRQPSKPMVYALANALGCTPADLDDDGPAEAALTLDIIAAQHAELGHAINELRARITPEVAA